MDRKKKSYNLLIGIAALVAIVAAVALVGYIVSEPDPIVLQGQAEAAEYRISGKVPGRVEKFYACEGDFVHKGDTLVKIESPEVQAKMAQAMAEPQITALTIQIIVYYILSCAAVFLENRMIRCPGNS